MCNNTGEWVKFCCTCEWIWIIHMCQTASVHMCPFICVYSHVSYPIHMCIHMRQLICVDSYVSISYVSYSYVYSYVSNGVTKSKVGGSRKSVSHVTRVKVCVPFICIPWLLHMRAITPVTITTWAAQIDRKKSPSLGGFPFWVVPKGRTRRKTTSLKTLRKRTPPGALGNLFAIFGFVFQGGFSCNGFFIWKRPKKETPGGGFDQLTELPEQLMWRSHGTLGSESWHRCKWVIYHMSSTNQAAHTFVCGNCHRSHSPVCTAYAWRSHGTHVKESWQTSEWVVAHM